MAEHETLDKLMDRNAIPDRIEMMRCADWIRDPIQEKPIAVPYISERRRRRRVNLAGAVGSGFTPYFNQTKHTVFVIGQAFQSGLIQ